MDDTACLYCTRPIPGDATVCPGCSRATGASARAVTAEGPRVGAAQPLSDSEHLGAKTAAAVFKIAAVAWLLVGVVVTSRTMVYLGRVPVEPTARVLIIVGELVATVIGASAIAFFGFVLELLRAIERWSRGTYFRSGGR